MADVAPVLTEAMAAEVNVSRPAGRTLPTLLGHSLASPSAQGPTRGTPLGLGGLVRGRRRGPLAPRGPLCLWLC